MASKGSHNNTVIEDVDSSRKRQKTSHDLGDDNRNGHDNVQQPNLPKELDRSRNRKLRTLHPTSIVTWNCNGFTSRTRWDTDKLSQLVQQTGYPDIICIQEARLRASGSHHHQRGKPQDTELFGCCSGGAGGGGKKNNTTMGGPTVDDALQSVFGEYHPVWSLADTKYAGTLTLLHRRLFAPADDDSHGGRDDDNSEEMAVAGISMKEFKKNVSSLAAFSPQSAIDLLLRKLDTTRKQCGLLSSSSSTSTSMCSSASSRPQKAQQTSVKSFFAPKTKNCGKIGSGDNGSTVRSKKDSQQTSVRSFFAPKGSSRARNENAANSPSSLPASRRILLPHHHPEGRFQFFCFPDMDILQTYVPNNGTKEESFQKRREWDQDMLQFLRDRKTILQVVEAAPTPDSRVGLWTSNRPLLWCGDLNVARDYRDGTHWVKSRDSSIYEWWKDESKCFVKADNKGNGLSKRPQDRGIPSFTDAERERFHQLLEEGDFCDVWRALHPNGDNDGNKSLSTWDSPNYTWRGHLAKEGSFTAKYQGKGQRLDYFLLSPAEHVKLKDFHDKETDYENTVMVEFCKILGHGERREGLFCGSDHCAVHLKLATHATLT